MTPGARRRRAQQRAAPRTSLARRLLRARLASPADRPRFDLPPRWDGQAVHWHGWTPGPVLVCRNPGRCPAHPATATSPINLGTIGDLGHHEPRVGDRLALPPALAAVRCPGCGTDVVCDIGTGQWWALSAADYGPRGATPTTRDPRSTP